MSQLLHDTRHRTPVAVPGQKQRGRIHNLPRHSSASLRTGRVTAASAVRPPPATPFWREMGEAKEDGEEVDVDCWAGGCGGGRLSALRVLVVDDSPVDRKIVEMLLKRSGGIFEVVSVDSGKKAMEVLGLNEFVPESSKKHGQKIDIVLTDYCMPKMTGFELLKAVKKHSSSRSIPVVIMSSEYSPERINRCRAIGAEDFIIKPLRVKDVQRLKAFTRPAALTPATCKREERPAELMMESGGPNLAKAAVALALLFFMLNYF